MSLQPNGVNLDISKFDFFIQHQSMKYLWSRTMSSKDIGICGEDSIPSM